MKSWIGALFALMSVICFALYGLDKSRAKRKRRRIPEATLLTVGFFGGALGALLAMRLFRHKTRHWYFWVINFAALAFQILLLLKI